MEEIYNKLNNYLNEICKYLEKKDSFLLENIDKISVINDNFYSYIKDFPLDMEIKENNITYEEVYLTARKIISNIDKSYLESFDKLIENGILDFSYENKYEDSHCAAYYTLDKLERKEININRKFNYDDVRVLIHEFIHFTNMKKITTSGHCFGEFLSIYFELFANDYLINNGVPEYELDLFQRLRNAKYHARTLFQYETIILSYTKFGKIDKNTVSLLQEYFLNIKEEIFNKECKNLYDYITKLENKYNKKVEDIASYICDEYISNNYRYVLGTVLGIYGRKYIPVEKVVLLNNHINEMDNLTFIEICKSIGIDLTTEEFEEKMFYSLEEYMSKIGLKM